MYNDLKKDITLLWEEGELTNQPPNDLWLMSRKGVLIDTDGSTLEVLTVDDVNEHLDWVLEQQIEQSKEQEKQDMEDLMADQYYNNLN